jgi:hypothetical protein
MVGAAWLPYIFWLLLRLLRQRGHWRTAILTGLVLGGLAVSHTPLTLLLIPVVSLFCLGWLALEIRQWRDLLRTISGLLLAAGVGLGLAAFFILPAIFEKNAVTFAGAAFGPNSYAPWPDALALWRPIYPNLSNYALFGTLHPLLALVGLIVLTYNWRKQKSDNSSSLRLALLLGALLLGLVLLQFSPSSVVWDAFPIFESVQFSARLMDFVVVLTTPLVGGLLLLRSASSTAKAAGPEASTTIIDTDVGTEKAGLGLKNKKLWPALRVYLVAGVVVALLGWASLGQLSFAYWPFSFDGSISLKALQAQIKNGDTQYLPQAATDLNAIQTFRQPVFADGRPSTTQYSLQLEPNGLTNRRLVATLSSAGWIVLPIFYYPGWHAFSDGQDLALQAMAQTGLLSFELPSGSHIVALDFTDTPVRFVSNILSVLTLLGLAILAGSRWFWYLLRKKKKIKIGERSAC